MPAPEASTATQDARAETWPTCRLFAELMPCGPARQGAVVIVMHCAGGAVQRGGSSQAGRGQVQSGRAAAPRPGVPALLVSLTLRLSTRAQLNAGILDANVRIAWKHKDHLQQAPRAVVRVHVPGMSRLSAASDPSPAAAAGPAGVRRGVRQVCRQASTGVSRGAAGPAAGHHPERPQAQPQHQHTRHTGHGSGARAGAHLSVWEMLT